MNYRIQRNDELMHYGIKGMKWGVRRYQNADGTLTDAGKKRVYKSLNKYSKSKDKRAKLGQAVGEDMYITEAAHKVHPAVKKYNQVLARRNAVASKMEQEHFNERDRLDKKYGSAKTEMQKMGEAWKNVRKKYGKELDTLEKQCNEARGEYDQAIREVVDAYLGKYGDKNIGALGNGRKAADALATQIDWGINLGRLNIR